MACDKVRICRLALNAAFARFAVDMVSPRKDKINEEDILPRGSNGFCNREWLVGVDRRMVLPAKSPTRQEPIWCGYTRDLAQVRSQTREAKKLPKLKVAETLNSFDSLFIICLDSSIL